jgi:hypothetical protein
MKTTIDMAREAGGRAQANQNCDDEYLMSVEQLKAFEALVRADQDEKYKWNIHSCGPTCTKAACVAMREAVLAEREACAQVVEEYPHWLGMTAKAEIANAIRNRGNT